MDEPERRISPLVNALWGSGITQPHPSREQLHAMRGRSAAILAMVWGLPLAVGITVALVEGHVLAGILAGGAMLLLIMFVGLGVGAITEPRRARKRG